LAAAALSKPAAAVAGVDTAELFFLHSSAQASWGGCRQVAGEAAGGPAVLVSAAPPPWAIPCELAPSSTSLHVSTKPPVLDGMVQPRPPAAQSVGLPAGDTLGAPAPAAPSRSSRMPPVGRFRKENVGVFASPSAASMPSTPPALALGAHAALVVAGQQLLAAS
jgi:hypothetical protein